VWPPLNGHATHPAAASYGDKVFTMSNRVAVLGGGVGGLSAAHEWIERGFEVTVYERKDVFGGTARSLSVPNTGINGRRDLPGER
jgi:15-cis-phytoene desaturase